MGFFTQPAAPRSRRGSVARHWLWLLLILLGASVLRLYGLRWATIIHPDERQIVMTVERLGPHDMNPHFFAYGSLPIYLIWLGKQFGEHLLGRPPNVYYLARAISAGASIATVLLTYALGAQCFGRRVGLWAAAFLAAAALCVQNAHYGTVDSLLALFMVGALWFAARFASDGRRRDAWAMVAVAGLALATKVSAAVLLFVLAWAYVRSPAWPRQRWLARLGSVALALAALAALFVALQPYVVLDFATFKRHVLEQQAMATGKVVYPYTIQFHGTIPVAYQARDLVLFTFGPALGLVCLIGLGPLVWDAARRRLSAEHLPTLYCLLYLATVLFMYAKFARYMLPAAPVLCLAGARFVLRLAERAQRPWPKRLAAALPALVLGYSVIHCAAYAAIYGKPHTLHRAEQWLMRNARPGAVVLCEDGWDLVPQVWGLRLELTDHYQPDSAAKVARLAEQLSRADFLFSASPRFYGSILRDPWRYPKTANYYVQLFSGRLGFMPEAQFEQPPRLLGLVQWRDDLGDESISVYDHPKVIIFRNVARLSPEEIARRIDERLLLDYGVERHKIMSRRASAGLAVQPVPSPVFWYAAHWWGIYFVWGWCVFPLLFLSLPALWERGYSVCKAAGVLFVSYLAWLSAALKLAPFNLKTVVICAFCAAGLGLFFLPIAARRGFFAWLRENWVRLCAIELAGVLFFCMVLAFRACQHAEPGQGIAQALDGEKLMDMGFVNSLWRHDEIPPPDHWYAGARVNYYYFGHVMAATVAHASVADFDYRYNLADAGFFALALLGVFGLGANLARRFAGGLWAVIFFAFMGNLAGVAELREHILFLRSHGALGHPWSLWRTCNVIPGTITECPFFTMVYGDLHAHMLEMSLGTLALALLLGLVALRRERRQPLSAREGAAAALGLGLVVGAIAMTNPWGAFSYGGLALVGLLWAFRPERPRYWLAFLRGLLPWLGAVAVAALCASPFFTAFDRGPVGQIKFTPQPASPGANFLMVFAVHLGVVLPFLLCRTLLRDEESSPAARPAAWVALCCLLLAAGAVGALWGLGQRDFLALGSVATLLLLALLARVATRQDSPDDFPLLLAFSAGAILLFSELFHITEFLSGKWFRVNTVMKFHHHAWLLLSLASAYGVLWLWRRRERVSPWLAEPYLAALILLLFCGAVTPLFGIPFRCSIPRGGPELSIMADVRRLDEPRYAALRWLTYHAAPGDVLAEAVGGAYSDRGLISAATGIPAVVNWLSHAFQWHHSWSAVFRRANDVRALYQSEDPQEVRCIIEKYSIDWVVLGASERQAYRIPERPALEKLATVAFRYRDTVVYKVSGQR